MFREIVKVIRYKTLQKCDFQQRCFASVVSPLTVGEQKKTAISWDDALPFEMIPGPKPLPLLGNTWRFFPIVGNYSGVPLHKLHELWRKEYGDILVLRNIIGKPDFVFTFSVADTETVFRHEGIWPIRIALLSLKYYRSNLQKSKGTEGIISLQGQEWGKYRSVVNTAMMQPRIIKRYIPTMEDIVDDFFKRIDYLLEQSPISEAPDDFSNELNKWGLETVSCIAFDNRLGCFDPNATKNSEPQKMINAVNEMFELLYQLDVLPSPWKHVSTPKWRRFVNVMDYITSVTEKYINAAEEKFKNSENKNDKEMSVLEKLLQKDPYVAYSNAVDMIMAGIDTTAKSVAAALYFLAINPTAQEKLREEAKQILPTQNSKLDLEFSAKAPYLRAVIKETQRIAPIAVGNQRRTEQDMVLSGYRVPKGTEIITCNMNMSNSEKYFPHAEQFLPERWLRETCPNEISARNTNPFVYMPFGHGPRSCVGKRIALNELEVFLIKFVRNYKIEWHHEEMKFNNKLIHGVDSPLNFKIIKYCD